MYNNHNYHNHNPYYAPCSSNHYSLPTPTKIHGLIVGVSRDGNHHFQMYSRNFDQLINISRQVQTRIGIGSWIEVFVNSPNFAGEFVLDDNNSYGYRYVDPDGKYTAARFFPSSNSNDPYYGEILVAARFGVKANWQTGRFEFVSYDIRHEHLIDEYDLIRTSDRFYEGRSFIVEAQAALDGFYVLQVHEDPRREMDCESVSANRLENSVVPHDVMFLEQTNLLPILTGDGLAPLKSRTPTPVEQVPSLPSPPAHSSKDSEVEHHEVESESNQSTSRRKAPSPTEQLSSGSQEVEDYDEETTEMTLGTSNIPDRQLVGEMRAAELKRYREAKGMGDEHICVLAVVVQLIPGGALLFSTTRGVSSVLLLEATCQGLENGIRLGDVAYFDVSQRRIETRDDLMPSLTFSHVAARKHAETASTKPNIDRFLSEIRSFGGLLEIRLKIDLSQSGNVTDSIDSTNLLKNNDTERNIYILKATNGMFATIPRCRLIHLLDEKLTAKFELATWAVYRKPVNGVALHIGEAGDAVEIYKDGRYKELDRVTTAFRS